MSFWKLAALQLLPTQTLTSFFEAVPDFSNIASQACFGSAALLFWFPTHCSIPTLTHVQLPMLMLSNTHGNVTVYSKLQALKMQ